MALLLRTLDLLIWVLMPIVLVLRWITADQRYSKWWDSFVFNAINAPGRLRQRVRDVWDSYACRRKAGRCLVCSYNLYRNASGVCPECGTPIHENRC